MVKNSCDRRFLLIVTYDFRYKSLGNQKLLIRFLTWVHSLLFERVAK